jgi:hypothetical protein
LRGELPVAGSRKTSLKPMAQAVWSEATIILGLAKILILKDVWSGPNQAKAHPFLAGVAGRKGITV